MVPDLGGTSGEGMDEGWTSGSRLGRADLGGRVIGEEVVKGLSLGSIKGKSWSSGKDGGGLILD